jgi:hypothetical protein
MKPSVIFKDQVFPPLFRIGALSTVKLNSIEGNMKKLLIATYSSAVLATFSLNVQAAEPIVCKASMMGRICYDANGKELSIAEMQAATADAQKKESVDKVAKK